MRSVSRRDSSTFSRRSTSLQGFWLTKAAQRVFRPGAVMHPASRERSAANCALAARAGHPRKTGNGRQPLERLLLALPRVLRLLPVQLPLAAVALGRDAQRLAVALLLLGQLRPLSGGRRGTGWQGRRDGVEGIGARMRGGKRGPSSSAHGTGGAAAPQRKKGPPTLASSRSRWATAHCRPCSAFWRRSSAARASMASIFFCCLSSSCLRVTSYCSICADRVPGWLGGGQRGGGGHDATKATGGAVACPPAGCPSPAAA